VVRNFGRAHKFQDSLIVAHPRASTSGGDAGSKQNAGTTPITAPFVGADGSVREEVWTRHVDHAQVVLLRRGSGEQFNLAIANHPAATRL